MPVSTRSHTKNNANPNQQQPHQGLKEKLKALTLLYEQHNFKNRSLKPEQEENHKENVKINVVAARKKLEMEKNGNRIMVFVRVRPIGKKEKEAGSRSCVRIVNRRDVYLTELVNPEDYLRLKRIRSCHYTFDACFPDSATQQEVYSTS
jgi:kinesin family protein 18/19